MIAMFANSASSHMVDYIWLLKAGPPEDDSTSSDQHLRQNNLPAD